MRHFLKIDLLVGGGIALGSAIIFVLDMSPIKGAADGAAYGLVIALAANFGRRAVIGATVFGVLLTLMGPLLGAEGDETLLQIFSGRILGLTVIILFAAVLLQMMAAKQAVDRERCEVFAYQRALRKITRLALATDKSTLDRFKIITEIAAETLESASACIAHIGEGGTLLRLHDIWDRRQQRHLVDPCAPASAAAELRVAVENDGIGAFTDIYQSEIHKPCLPFFDRLKLRAILHAAASYRGEPAGSLILCYEQPRRFTERECAFAKSVSQVVGMILAIDRSEHNLERLDYVSQSIFVLSGEGRVLYANKAGRDLGGTGEGLPAVPFSLSLSLDQADQHEVSYLGREFDVYRTRLPGGEILVRIDDVTARNGAIAGAKRMEEQMRESAKLQAMGQMASGIAHDFNNILASIMGFGQVLVRKLQAGPEQECANRILGVCKKGQSLTQEILGFAKTASVEKTAVDLSEVLAAEAELAPDDDGTSASFTVLPSPERLVVRGNSAQLVQLLQNLVVNALHACEGPQGCVIVSAGLAEPEELAKLSGLGSHERLLGVLHEGAPYCYLKVADNGHGIAPDVLDRMFEPFFTTKGRRNGSGLGLVVVHGVVDSHGGACHVRSVPGEGTVFTIYLPLLAEQAVAAA